MNAIDIKMDYKTFITDIYNSIKKTNLCQQEIIVKLENIDKRLKNIETSQTYLASQIHDMQQRPATATTEDISSKLLDMVTELQIDSTELPELYKLNTEFKLAELLNTPDTQPREKKKLTKFAILE